LHGPRPALLRGGPLDRQQILFAEKANQVLGRPGDGDPSEPGRGKRRVEIAATAFEAWESTSPLTNASAPATPFAMPGYELADSRQARQLEATASRQFSQATEANQRADNYILLTVLFALVLFFGAVSTRFDARSIQITLLSVGAVVFVVVAVITTLFPVEF
jgi:hypothetical protein